MDSKNKLYFGDNLKILREYVPDASVDLIYLDPPFNSSAAYNVLFKNNVAQGPLSGPAAFRLFSASQITAFEDTWQWSQEAEVVDEQSIEHNPQMSVTVCILFDLTSKPFCSPGPIRRTAPVLNRSKRAVSSK